MGSLGRLLDPERRARALLVECLAAAAEERPRPPTLAAGPIPWDRFVARSPARRWRRRRRRTSCLGAGARIGGGARGALEEAYQNGAARNALLLRDAAEIQLALRGAGAESVALKGAALVAAHYPALGARHVGDLDLLVRRDDLGRVREALARLGMRQAAANPVPPPRPTPTTCRPSLTRGGLSCEVHLLLPGEGDGDVEGVFSRSREISWLGRALRIPSPADLAGIACAHALSHHLSDARFRARLVADLAVLAAARRSGRGAPAHHGPAVDAALRLVAAARAGRPGAVLPLLLGRRLEGPVRRAAGLGVTFGRAARRGRLGPILVPDRAALARRHGVSAEAPLLPLLYFYRPFRALFRVLTGR